MRVLFVIDSLGPGGAERSSADLLRSLAGSGHRVVVACLHRSAEGVEQEVVAGGIPVHHLRADGWLGRIRELRALVREERPDIVHSTLFEADLVTRLACARLPVVVLSSLVNTTYGPMRLRDANIKRHRLALVRLADSWTGRHLTDHFHAVSPAVRDSAVERLRLAPERITVVERGRDPARLGEPGPARRAEARRTLGWADDDEVVVNVGRREFQKGQRYLIESIARLATRRPGLRLAIVGREGHASEDLAALATRLDVVDRTEFLGHRDDVPDILVAADLFAFPSMYEGLPGALLEAMALAVPIVASDIAPIRDVVVDGETATLVPPGDTDALAEAIDELLGDPEKAHRFTERGRELFTSRFTAERSNRRMAELYESLAAARARGWPTDDR